VFCFKPYDILQTHIVHKTRSHVVLADLDLDLKLVDLDLAVAGLDTSLAVANIQMYNRICASVRAERSHFEHTGYSNEG